MQTIKVILTGSTGMVGEGVLMECLANNTVAEVLMVNRKHNADVSHPKLRELVMPDFLHAENFSEQLKGYDSCFYCAGKSSAGMSEKDYTILTYDTTIHFARVLKEQNPGLVFNFVSGSHTDSSEKGKVMWARVKGKTENELMRIFGKDAYNFRPGLMKPSKGQKNFRGYNKLVPTIMFRVMKLFFPQSTIQQIGQAMINTTLKGYPKQVLEVADIVQCAG